MKFQIDTKCPHCEAMLIVNTELTQGVTSVASNKQPAPDWPKCFEWWKYRKSGCCSDVYLVFLNENSHGIYFNRDGTRSNTIGHWSASIALSDQDNIWKPIPLPACIVEKNPGLFVVKENKQSAFASQIGGSHYKTLAIQPAEFCQKNHLGFCESSVVKYVTRHREKNGKQDIEKAIHFLNLLIEMEYSNLGDDEKAELERANRCYELSEEENQKQIAELKEQLAAANGGIVTLNEMIAELKKKQPQQPEPKERFYRWKSDDRAKRHWRWMCFTDSTSLAYFYDGTIIENPFCPWTETQCKQDSLVILEPTIPEPIRLQRGKAKLPRWYKAKSGSVIDLYIRIDAQMRPGSCYPVTCFNHKLQAVCSSAYGQAYLEKHYTPCDDPTNPTASPDAGLSLNTPAESIDTGAADLSKNYDAMRDEQKQAVERGERPDSLEARYALLKETIRQVQKTRDKLESENAELKRANKCYELSEDENQKQIAELNEQLAATNGGINTLNELIAELKRQVERLEKQISIWVKSHGELTNQFDGCGKRITELESDINILKEENHRAWKSSDSWQTSYRTNQAKFTEIHGELSCREQEVAELKLLIERLENDLNTVSTTKDIEIGQLEAKFVECRGDDTSGDLSKCSHRHQIDTLTNQVESLTTKLAAAEADAKTARDIKKLDMFVRPVFNYLGKIEYWKSIIEKYHIVCTAPTLDKSVEAARKTKEGK
jgi:TolA-binding protein